MPHVDVVSSNAVAMNGASARSGFLGAKSRDKKTTVGTGVARAQRMCYVALARCWE